MKRVAASAIHDASLHEGPVQLGPELEHLPRHDRNIVLLRVEVPQQYDGYVALGCVIRGETTHYDYVCTESARGLMDLNLGGVICGNGILTVENRDQAIKRAVDKKKGADAANAALALIALRDKFGAEA